MNRIFIFRYAKSRKATRYGEAEMSTASREWLNLACDGFTFFAGISGVGNLLFPPGSEVNSEDREKKSEFETRRLIKFGWCNSGGFFYTVSKKQKVMGVAPEQVRWFRWEALTAWVGRPS